MKRNLKRFAVAAVVFAVIALVLTSPYVARAATDLQGESIYEIMVDRFYDGNPANNATGDAFRYGENSQDDFRYMHGGDWQGVIDKLSYIKNMGYTAIWISPVGDPQLWGPPDSSGFQWPTAYHGYNVYDPNTANRYFGSSDPTLSRQKLKDLVDAAHAQGIKVILDVVPNHVGDYLQGTGGSAHYLSGGSYRPGTQLQPVAPFNTVGWYHNLGDIVNWTDATECENHDLGGLDDIDYNNSTGKTAMLNAIQYWFTYTGADAARVDAAKCMFASDIHAIETNSGIASFGECFDMSVDRVAGYVGTGGEWGMLDFPLFQAAVNGFAYGQNFDDMGYGVCSLKNIFSQDYKYNGWENHMVTFLDNHDRNRFLTEAGGDVQKLRNALTFLFTARGVPVVFQGTEQDKGNAGNNYISGIADTWNRWNMVQKDSSGNVITNYFNRTTDTLSLVTTLNQLRQNYEALRTGKQREMWAAQHLYAFSRRVESGANIGQEVMCVFSNTGSSQTVTMPVRAESTVAVGTTLMNLLNSSDTVVVQAGGVTGKQITVSLGGNSAKLYGNMNDTTPPTPPGSLTSPSKTSSSISLSWSASTDSGSGVAGYNVYSSGGTLINPSLITTTTYNVTGLSSNTPYSFYVKARDNAGNLSDQSNTVNVTTDPYTGNKATVYYKRGFATPYFHYQQANGTWTAVPGTAMSNATGYTGYSVITDVEMGSNTTLIACFNDGNGNWDSRNGQNYSFPVGVSTFDAGTITAGPPISDTTPPTAPSSLSSPSQTSSTISLSWSASTDSGSGVAGYDVYRNNTKVNTSLITTTNYTDTGLAAGTSYSYYVKAKDAAGNTSDASNTITATTQGVTTIPVTFTINNATTYWGQSVYIAGNTVDLGSWNTSSAIGPASCPNYPTWTITINLVAGESIQFKAIKKDGSNVVWEGGGNHTYTVPSSGTGSVTWNWVN